MNDGRPLHIALLSEHASPAASLGGEDRGGQNVYVDQVSRALGLLGHEVDVYTRREDPTTPTVIEWAPGVRVVHLEAGPARVLPKDEIWPYMDAFGAALRRFMDRTGAHYDVLHGNFWMSGAVAADLSSSLHIPLVQIFHAMGLTKKRHQGTADTSAPERIVVERSVVRRAERTIAQCPAERDELVFDYDADPARIALIPSGVDTGLFRPVARDEARDRIGIKGDGPVVVYVGRMLPRKDVRNIVRALAELVRRGGPAGAARLLLVGGEAPGPHLEDPSETGVLQRLAHELGVLDRVHFVGQQQQAVLRYYYAAGDVVATTPWYEPFGLTPLEAMACGRPVVGSAVGGLTYTIDDGVSGLLVPPRDPVALADKLSLLLADPVLAARLGAQARVRVETLFSWPVVGERTAALYRQVLSSTAKIATTAGRVEG